MDNLFTTVDLIEKMSIYLTPEQLNELNTEELSQIILLANKLCQKIYSVIKTNNKINDLMDFMDRQKQIQGALSPYYLLLNSILIENPNALENNKNF
jgi:hypothetical protein